jgi:hypothetical protein
MIFPTRPISEKYDFSLAVAKDMGLMREALR